MHLVFPHNHPRRHLRLAHSPQIMSSNGFAALMALSQAQTQESTRTADSIQAERRRKEETRRRQQEEEDRKERERQAKMLRHQLEEQKREKERQAKKEQERLAKLKEMERREEEQRQALLYGPRKAKEGSSRYPTSSTTNKRISDDDGEADGGLALTREEKRERRLQLQFSQNAARRAGSSVGSSRVGRRLPGGGINTTASSSRTADGSASGGRSVRARLAAMPNTLTKLNTVKRDTRTIDEILRDRAKARENKTLEGEEARDFHDWFGTKPKGAMVAKTSSPPSPVTSGASTPSALPHRLDSTSSATKKSSSPRPTGSRAPSLPLSRSAPKTTAKSSSHAAKASRPSPLTNKTATSSSAPPTKKRPHSTPSESEYDSEYDRRPRKRASGPSNGIQDEIWKIFGRDRSKYVSRDVLSDEEDMEADARALEREELTRCATSILVTPLITLIWYSAPGLPGRRTSRPRKKSVVMKRRNAVVARSESVVVDIRCPLTIWFTFISPTFCLGSRQRRNCSVIRKQLSVSVLVMVFLRTYWPCFYLTQQTA